MQARKSGVSTSGTLDLPAYDEPSPSARSRVIVADQRECSINRFEVERLWVVLGHECFHHVIAVMMIRVVRDDVCASPSRPETDFALPHVFNSSPESVARTPAVSTSARRFLSSEYDVPGIC